MRRCLSCWNQAMSRSAPRGSRPCWEPSTTRPFAMCMWRRWICASSTSCSVRRRCCHERGPSDQNGVDGEPERAASAGDARVLRAGRAPGRERDTQLRAVPAAVDRAGVRGSTAEPHRRTAARVGSAAGEDDGKLRPEAFTRQGRTTTEALVDGSFLDRQENLLLFGNPGAGKSHLLCALAHELIAQGRRMKYTSCAMLVQDLLVAKRDLRLSKEIKKLARHDGLIIDEMGYVQQSREEMEVLFTLLSERYERGSVLLTSNLPFSKWEGIFKDPMTTAAAIDRLVHHSVIVELNIPSYRMEEAKKNRDPASENSEAN